MDAYAAASRPLELALTSEDAAAAFVRQGDPGRARPLLEQAIAIYERLGAARDLARADAVLRLAGVRRGVRGPRNRPQFGWQSLTPTERTVADLVADGLSNPQIGERLFISRRTVQTHLVHVFAKLGISSRSQLAAQVARRRRQASWGNGAAKPVGPPERENTSPVPITMHADAVSRVRSGSTRSERIRGWTGVPPSGC